MPLFKDNEMKKKFWESLSRALTVMQLMVIGAVMALIPVGINLGLAKVDEQQDREALIAAIKELAEKQESDAYAGISKAIHDAIEDALADGKLTVEQDEVEVLNSHFNEPNDIPDLPDAEESDLDVVSVTPEEYMLICRCVQTEAGEWAENSRYAKREYYDSKVAICNVILNLAEMKGLSITETICNHGRFEVWPNMINSCTDISTQTKKAVNAVLSGAERDTEVNCFRSKHYHGFGKSMYAFAGSYFSHYDE